MLTTDNIDVKTIIETINIKYKDNKDTQQNGVNS